MVTRRQLLSAAGMAAAAAAAGAWLWNRGAAGREREARRAEYQRRIATIQKPPVDGAVARLGMGGFLQWWSDEVLLRLRRARFPLDALQAELLRRGSLLAPAATDADIQALADRVGFELPASLQAMYRASNGFSSYMDYAKEPLALLPADRTRWMHELDPRMVDDWNKAGIPEAADAKYFVYGEAQDTVVIRPSYMRRLLCLGPIVDGGVLCVNPAVRFPDGELEAWDFSVKYPGARRFKTLAGLLEWQCGSDCWNLDERSVLHGWSLRG